jgi:hypothetical protein
MCATAVGRFKTQAVVGACRLLAGVGTPLGAQADSMMSGETIRSFVDKQVAEHADLAVCRASLVRQSNRPAPAAQSSVRW